MAPRHSTHVLICGLRWNLSTVSSRYCRISACSASSFDQFGLRLKLKEYSWEWTSHPL